MESSAKHLSPFVGRERELAELRRLLGEAANGRGHLAMVVGEPGIGKTALCEQLAAQADARGAQTLVGHCFDEGSIPYLPFVEALLSYAHRRDPDALRQELEAGAQDVGRLIPEIGSLLAVASPPTGDPEADRWQLFEAVATLLRNAAAARPLLLVLEDLHWADRGTLDLLVHIARNLQGSHVLAVGTYRDLEVDRAHPLSAALGELRRIGSFSRIRLQGLDLSDVHLLYGELRGSEVPLSEAERVHEQTEGNPLFVQELVRYLVEGGFEGRKSELDVIPEGLRDVIGLRLNRLSPDCNQALAVASVIGREFDMATLEGLLTSRRRGW